MRRTLAASAGSSATAQDRSTIWTSFLCSSEWLGSRAGARGRLLVMAGQDGVVVAAENEAVNDHLELAHVAGPVVMHHGREDVAVELRFQRRAFSLEPQE